MIERNKIYEGHAINVLRTFPDESINMVITSPPYYALRDYGLEGIVWDGDKNCEHDFEIKEEKNPMDRGGHSQHDTDGKVGKMGDKTRTKVYQGYCSKCNAWRGQLGFEPNFDLYIDHLCQIFDEVKRVLTKDGTCWVNLGDTYQAAPVSGKQGGFSDKAAKNNPDYGNVVLVKKPKSRLKNKTLLQIPARFAIEMCDRGWILRNDLIWKKPNCLCGSTVLYAWTQKGIILSSIKDLSKLDPKTVMLWDGEKWQRVNKWVKNDNPKDIKEITFRNGEIIKCTGEHLFPLDNGNIIPAHDLKVGNIVKHTKLPKQQKEVECIPDDMGWFIGTYLADGSMGDKKRCLQFSSNINERKRFDRLKTISEKYDATCNEHAQNGNATTFNIYSKILISIINTYIGGKTSKDKHLTSYVWRRNNSFLENLLMGYLDGDGHYDKTNNRYRLGFTKNDYLARDIRTLCARLNYAIKIQKGTSKLGNKVFKKYGGEIRINRSYHHNMKSDYEIINIKHGKKLGYFWDIVLDNEPHLFATHSGMLIHNCFPSSVKDRFTVDYEHIFFFVKNEKYYFEQQFEPYAFSTINDGRFEKAKEGNYTGGTNIKEGYEKSGAQNPVEVRNSVFNKGLGQGRNMRSVWTITTKGFKGAHFATFNESLIETPIKAGCPEFICKKCGKPRIKIYENLRDRKEELAIAKKLDEEGSGKYKGDEFTVSTGYAHRDLSPDGKTRGMYNLTKEAGYSDCGCDHSDGWNKGVVLDPFIGSGTTAVMARKLGRDWVGIELSKEYINIAEKRINEGRR